MASLLRMISKKYQQGGFRSLLSVLPANIYSEYLRPILLLKEPYVTRIAKYNDIEVPVEIQLDEKIPGYTPDINSKPKYENSEVEAIKEYCKTGDEVVIIGAGSGVTAVTAADVIGMKGQVTAYEPAFKMYCQARQTININNISEAITIHHAAVGKVESTWGRPGRPDKIDASEIPDCDYLEIDCEGAERSILKYLDFSPRVISVETHKQYGVSIGSIINLLEVKGYTIVKKKDKKEDGIHHLVAINETQ